jgi:UDP-glucose 4-epimerase
VVLKPVHQFANQKVLVTGASGFIGSHLCRRLCLDAAEVHAVATLVKISVTSMAT